MFVLLHEKVSLRCLFSLLGLSGPQNLKGAHAHAYVYGSEREYKLKIKNKNKMMFNINNIEGDSFIK